MTTKMSKWGGPTTVREILELHDEVETLLEASEGECTEAIEGYLTALEGSTEDKLARMHGAGMSYRARAEWLTARAKALGELAAVAETRACRCDGAAMAILKGRGLAKYDLPDGAVKIAQGRERVVETEAGAVEYLPNELVSTKIERRPDKAAIRDRLRKGDEVRGFSIVRGPTKVRWT